MNTMAESTHVISGVVSDEAEAASGLTAPSSHVAQSGSQTNRQWQVLVVDDDAVDRTLLRGLLEEHADLQVVGEASDGEEAIVLAERYRPDVILMDIHLGHVSGVETTRHIKKKLPQSLIIGVSCLYTPQSYISMITAGAVAFVRKEDAVEALYKTIEFATLLPKSTSIGPHDSPDGKTNGSSLAASEFPKMLRTSADPEEAGHR